MNNVVNFTDKKNEAKEIIIFKDGRMSPKNDSRAYVIIKKFLLPLFLH